MASISINKDAEKAGINKDAQMADISKDKAEEASIKEAERANINKDKEIDNVDGGKVLKEGRNMGASGERALPKMMKIVIKVILPGQIVVLVRMMTEMRRRRRKMVARIVPPSSRLHNAHQKVVEKVSPSTRSRNLLRRGIRICSRMMKMKLEVHPKDRDPEAIGRSCAQCAFILICIKYIRCF